MIVFFFHIYGKIFFESQVGRSLPLLIRRFILLDSCKTIKFSQDMELNSTTKSASNCDLMLHLCIYWISYSSCSTTQYIISLLKVDSSRPVNNIFGFYHCSMPLKAKLKFSRTYHTRLDKYFNFFISDLTALKQVFVSLLDKQQTHRLVSNIQIKLDG